MVEDPIDFGLAAEDVDKLPNVPVCPICTNILENASSDYRYLRIQPDTRWFWCEDCESHIGYHRMKGTWKLDLYDYSSNNKLRERIGLPPAQKP